MPAFGQSEADGQVRLDRRPHDLSRIRTDTGGDVHGDDRSCRFVDEGDDLPGNLARWVLAAARQSCAKNGVHQQVAFLQSGPQGLPVPLYSRGLGQLQQVSADLFIDLKVGLRISLGLLFSAQEEDADPDPSLVQVPGDDQAVSAVVSLSGDDDHRFMVQV